MTSSTATPQQRVDVSRYEKLDRKQAGHLRHFHNMVTQPDGQWKHFDTLEYFQEFDDSSRYQLATMAYAAGAAHFHRLPALRGPFQTLMRQMITRMLRREVWAYWFISSHGSKMFDPSMTELRVPWADPVRSENIMYSGHLLLMTSLYTMLFDDDTFEQKDGMVFSWDPLFTGLGPERYAYSISSLQDVIVKQMEANGWVGVCCEPNAVFVVCNQFPLIAMRYNDVRNGTDVIGDILPKYKDALHRKGLVLREDGLYASFYAVKQGQAIPGRQGAHTAWANAFMHAWNPEFVHATYAQSTFGFLTNFNNKTELNPTRVAIAFRKLVAEGLDKTHPATLEKARNPTHHVVNPRMPFETLNWGTFTMMLSELGKKEELNDLLGTLDERLNPTWERGGLYYPRNDVLADEDWRLTHMEPHSGNSGVGYARLNVTGGQKTMWEEPWTREVLAGRPWVERPRLGDDVDFLRGVWDGDEEAMILTMRRWQGEGKQQMVSVRNLSEGSWAIFVDGRFAKEEVLPRVGDIAFEVGVGQQEVDVVIEKLRGSGSVAHL